jgi:hypothetical protein
MTLASLLAAGNVHHPLVAVGEEVFVCSARGAEGSGRFPQLPEEMLYVFPQAAAF